MKKILLLFSLAFLMNTFSQDSLSVLFIGNSYTSVNDLPGMLNNLTTSLGDEITYDSQAIGGATFQNHWNNLNTYTKIQSRSWDYVVLQGQSQEPSFPYDQVNTNTIPYAINLADSVYANNVCSQVLLYMTWGRQNGDPQWDSINTFDKMNLRLRNAYLRIMDSVNGSVSPVGVAWKYIRDTHPEINLYSSDGSHPSVEGTYLTACTFYTSLFRKSPVGASYAAGLSTITAGILQEAAYGIVMDSITTWHLHGGDEVTQAEFEAVTSGQTIAFTNLSQQYEISHWDFGDGQTSTEVDPEHTYQQSGTYNVQLIVEGPCDSDTISQEFFIEDGENGIEENDFKANLRIENWGENTYRLTFNGDGEMKFSLQNVQGQCLLKDKKMIDGEEIDLNAFESGVYCLVVYSKNEGCTIFKLYKR